MKKFFSILTVSVALTFIIGAGLNSSEFADDRYPKPSPTSVVLES